MYHYGYKGTEERPITYFTSKSCKAAKLH